MKKGQVSIEFLFISLIILLYISLIVLPNIDLSSNSTQEVAGVSQARLAAERIASTANNVALSGNRAKQTIIVHVPQNAVIECSEETVPDIHAKITFNYTLQNTDYPIPECQPNNICSKELKTVLGQEFDCINFPVNGNSNPEIIIEKTVTPPLNQTTVIISAIQQ